MYRYVIWDWNGTLLNDVEIAMEVMNEMLARRSLPMLRSLDHYRDVFTFPVREYYIRVGLDLEKEPFQELEVEWTMLYREKSQNCGLFQQGEAVLQALQKQGIGQLIVSASPQETLECQVESQGVKKYFQALLGLSDIYADSKAGLARRYFVEQDIRPEEVLFVGDTLHDWEVAQDAGCPCVLLAQGHQSRQRLETAGVPVLESVTQVPGFLLIEERQF